MNFTQADFAIRNARIVTADAEFTGALAVRAGRLSGLASASAGLAGADWHGDYLLPGLVELHTDNLEKHVMPRPQVGWPALPAILAHDAQIAAAGITSVLDAIAVGDITSDSLRMQSMAGCLRGLREAAAAGLLRTEHFLHLRLELAEPGLLPLFQPLLQDPRLKLVSLMDHTPGQRQWTDLHQYRVHVSGMRGWSDQKIEQMMVQQQERQQRHVAANRAQIIRLCRQQSQPVVLASHDDASAEHVLQGVAEGVALSEFPTTVQAAAAARAHGLAIVMGAPNLVRGGSHSGNVAAGALARQGLLDILSSDYVPASLLHAAFLLPQHGYTLPQALATVSRRPAQIIGLADRGEIADGLRADFLRVRLVHGIPVVLGAWRQGRQIA